jgi:hypothetical protein
MRETYMMAIHAAVIACAGKDCYTGEDLAREKISTYDNEHRRPADEPRGMS